MDFKMKWNEKEIWTWFFLPSLHYTFYISTFILGSTDKLLYILLDVQLKLNAKHYSWLVDVLKAATQW